MAADYYALIPAYEPDKRMLDVIKDMKSKGFEIIVVDDGSGKAYSDLFEQAEEYATVLTHNINKGKGAALKTGLAYISKYKICGGASPQDVVIVTVDADGQHRAKDAFRIAAHAAAKPGSLILGSRGLEEDVPIRSKFGNAVTRHVYRLSTGIPIHDTQTGLRAFTADMIPDLLQIHGERYEYEINMLLEFADKGIPIIEEEIETVYLDGNQSSHFNTIKDSIRIYREILKFSASSIIGFLVDYGMYALLLLLTAKAAIPHGLIVSNIGARVVSSMTNFTINRKLVFRSNAGLARSAAQYFALAALILAGNTAVLSVLTGTFGVNSMIAKIITEMMMFSVSWLVQKYVIFYTVEEQGSGSERSSVQNKVTCSGRHPVRLRTRKPSLRAAFVRSSGSDDVDMAGIEGGQK